MSIVHSAVQYENAEITSNFLLFSNKIGKNLISIVPQRSNRPTAKLGRGAGS
jgi:hypothetical protein